MECPDSFPAAQESSGLVVRTLPNVDRRWGNSQAEILGIQLLDPSGKSVESIDHGEALTVRVSVRFKENVKSPIVGHIL